MSLKFSAWESCSNCILIHNIYVANNIVATLSNLFDGEFLLVKDIHLNEIHLIILN